MNLEALLAILNGMKLNASSKGLTADKIEVQIMLSDSNVPLDGLHWNEQRDTIFLSGDDTGR